ncbi:gamma-glutamyl-gamma-aminobutyrate hydrolase family protein [Rhizobacter sp. P5_C2]
MIRNPSSTSRTGGAKRHAHERRDSSGSEGGSPPRTSRQRATTDLSTLGRPPRMPVTVAYRDSGHGTGAFWDHYTMQQTTGRESIASHPDGMEPTISSTDPTKPKNNYSGGLPRQHTTTTGEGRGLLVIAGGNYGLESEMPRHAGHTPKGSAAERHQQRREHEEALLKQAQLTGRPVAGLCGGSWSVLESYGGTTQQVKSNTHQARSMPFIKKNGDISNNFEPHGVDLEPGTMLHSQSAWQRQDPMDVEGGPPPRPHWENNRKKDKIRYDVNSVHWAAAREDEGGLVPRDPQDEALAARLGTLQVSARDTTHRSPFMDAPRGAPLYAAEAFESRSGPPVMGMQWHPEAYSSGHADKPAAAMSQNALNYMAKAGDAYEARQANTDRFRRDMQSSRAHQPSGIGAGPAPTEFSIPPQGRRRRAAMGEPVPSHARGPQADGWGGVPRGSRPTVPDETYRPYPPYAPYERG